MRLFPRELEIGADEGFTPQNDIFGRKEFGDRLTRIVRVLEGPAVLVLDAHWGTGKTTFVKMWRGELTKLGIPSIYFDAFANDHHEDAFLTLAGEILARAKELKSLDKKAVSTFKKQTVRVAKAVGRASLRLGARIATAGLLSGEEVEEELGSVVETASDEAGKAVDDFLSDQLESHHKERKAFTEFAAALQSLVVAMIGAAEKSVVAQGERAATDDTSTPLVFIIDELDRCRPPFALALLEKIKHFFSVPGVIFLLVTNIAQVEAAVRQAYGVDVDARTYLEKFYHFRLLFPAGTAERRDLGAATYLRHLSSILPKREGDQRFTSIANLVAQYARVASLSFRSLERIASYISLVIVSMPKDHFCPSEIVAGLCVMKVVAPEYYAAARTGRLIFTSVNQCLRFSEWRSDHDPVNQSREGQRSEEWWTFTLSRLGNERRANELQQILDHYSVSHPSHVLTYLCDIIDGFSFPNT